MSIRYRRTIVICCDKCLELQEFAYVGEGTDWKEANEYFFRLGWTLSKGKHECPSCVKQRKVGGKHVCN